MNVLFQIAAAEERVTPAAAPGTEGIMGHALMITLIGMIILFLSLLVLWGIMELLVKFVKDSPKKEDDAEVSEATVSDDDDLKRQVAAAAAAFVSASK